MATMISQTPQQLGLKLDAADGSTLHSEFYNFSGGAALPDFPEAGGVINLNIGADVHVAQITSRTFTYFLAGNAITTLLTIAAKKLN
jgi:hypothetical protein